MNDDTFAWGKVALHLDDKEFAEGFAFGRRLYFEESTGHRPHRAKELWPYDVCDQLAREKGEKWVFGWDAQERPMLHIGALVGWLSGPLTPETDEERAAREGIADARN